MNKSSFLVFILITNYFFIIIFLYCRAPLINLPHLPCEDWGREKVKRRQGFTFLIRERSARDSGLKYCEIPATYIRGAEGVETREWRGVSCLVLS